VQVRCSAILEAGISLDEELACLFAVLDRFIELNIRSEWGTLCEDYAFVLEGPSSAAEALDHVAGAGDSAVVLPVVPFDGNGDADAEGDIEELGDKSSAALVVPPVAAMPRPKPGGSKSVPGEWNKLAREKKLADELAKKAKLKGKGLEDGKAVALSLAVATRCSGAHCITSVAVVPDTNKEAEGAKKAGESPEVAPASRRSKAVEVVLLRTRAASSKGKGVSLSPRTTFLFFFFFFLINILLCDRT
jgi:hypothetical protein